MTEQLGTFYTIWMNDNSSAALDPEDMPLVERGMRLWADSRRDSWLSVHQPGGADFMVLASTITSAQVTTPEQRSAATFRDKAAEDERAENRRNAGYIESA